MGQIIVGFLGVILGSIITGYKEIWLDYRANRKNAEHLAIQLICILDSYVEGCAEVASDNGLSYGQRNSEGETEIQTQEPLLMLPKTDEAWKALPVQIMYKILSFPNSIVYANKSISAAFEHANPPDWDQGFEQRQYQYSVLGLKAAAIASELRSTYKLPEIVYDVWNPINCLKETKSRIESERNEQHKRNLEMFEEMEKKFGPPNSSA